MKTILGIDPGSNYTGFGIIKIKNNSNKGIYITSGIINLSKISNFDEKLSIIYNNMLEIIDKYQPDYAGIEDLFVYKNVQSAIKLSHARAACILALANSKIKYKSFAPRYVKKNITGHGNADKDGVMQAVKYLLNLNHNDELKTDASDALAIALTCSYSLMKEF